VGNTEHNGLKARSLGFIENGEEEVRYLQDKNLKKQKLSTDLSAFVTLPGYRS
jgi:hypothetical protein